MAVVNESVEQRCREDGVAEDVAPFGEGFVTRDDGRSMFVALGHELEEPGGSGLVKLHVTKFVDNEERDVIKVPLLVPRNAFELRGMNVVEQILCGEEINTYTGLQRFYSQADREMRFSHAWRSKQRDSFRTIEKRESLQIVDDATVECGLGIELKRVERLDDREVSEFCTHRDAALFACGQLIGEERIENRKW